VLGLGLALFMPIAPAGILGLVVWALEMLVLMLLGVTAVRVGIGRMRIDQAFAFFLKWPLLAALASLAVVVVA
jgi:NADH-quinone oxidoreductase subunit H